MDLVQLVRFLEVKLTHLVLNPKFDMDATFITNYSLIGGDISVDSDVLLVIDFVNLKIKSAQSFRCAHKDRVCVYVFIYVSDHTCMSIYVCTVFLKKR
jgi:hypothetical protein